MRQIVIGTLATAALALTAAPARAQSAYDPYYVPYPSGIYSHFAPFPSYRYYDPGYKAIFGGQYRAIFGLPANLRLTPPPSPGTAQHSSLYVAPPGPRERLRALVREHLRVQQVESGLYSVSWNGPAAALSSLEVRAVDPQGKELAAVALKQLPLRGRLRVPPGTAAVLVSLRADADTAATVRFAGDDFRRLAVE